MDSVGAAGENRIELRLIGPFRVRASDGTDLTPSLRKSCALLALLALSPRKCRSRMILQDKLWSTREQEQGLSSLRQALTEIRKSFKGYSDCLRTDLRVVSLDPESVDIDLETIDLATLAIEQSHDRPVLLECLDDLDPEFDEWVRDQRSAFETRLDDAAERSPIRGPAFPGPAVPQSTDSGFAGPANTSIRPSITILPPRTSSGDSGAFVAQLMSDTVAHGLAEKYAVEVAEHDSDTTGLGVRTEAIPVASGMCVHVTLLMSATGVRLWSGSRTVPNASGLILDAPEFQMLINQAIDIAGRHLSNVLNDRGPECATLLALDAVNRMFTLDPADLDRADACLEAAYERDPQGVYLAWRAYARTFDHGEHRTKDCAVLKEEAAELIHRAIEAEPQNTTILALASYAYCFLFHNFAVGHELAEQSLRTNPANVLGLAYLGRAKSYLGQHEEAYHLTDKARKLSGPAPYQYTLDFLCGMTALLSGRTDEAIRLAEIARARAPFYRPPMRYLVPLYLRNGETAKAREIVSDLREIEPSFSLNRLRETSYPSAGLRQAGLLEYRDEDLQG